MKKNVFKNAKASAKVQEIHTVAIIVLAVAVLVLSAIVAVLLTQASSHRRSIEGLYNITTGLPTSEE